MIDLNKIHKGHVLEILKLIDNNSIDCIVTSPPYYGLRSYKTEPQIWLDGKADCKNHQWVNEIIVNNSGGGWNDPDKRKNHPTMRLRDPEKENQKKVSQGNFCINCNAWKGELGLEPTFQLFLTHLFQIFDEIYRVLKPTGTCWVNLGDTYSGSEGSHKNHHKNSNNFNRNDSEKQSVEIKPQTGAPAKSLLQIPSRFAVGMTDRGWILRNEIIWYKRSCMPTSAKDRFTVDFEKIFFFTKSTKYFFEQQFEKLSDSVLNDYRYLDPELNTLERKDRDDISGPSNGGGVMNSNPLGRNKRCVWDITSEPFPEAHFATFPQSLVEPMIKAGCPEEICNKCKKPKEKIFKPDFIKTGGLRNTSKGMDESNGWSEFLRGYNENNFIGFTDCKCNAGYHPGIVLDPFIGSGTTGIVARKLNRNFIGIELQDKYIEIAERRMEKELGFFK